MQDAIASTPLAQRVKELEAELLTAHRRVEALEAERERLYEAYENLRTEVELLRRRLFAAKAERIDTAQLELEFAEKGKLLDALRTRLQTPCSQEDRTSVDDETSSSGDEDPPPSGDGPKPPLPPTPPPKRRVRGRRNLRNLPLVEERIEVADPLMEALVRTGEYECMGFESSATVRWRRAGLVRIVLSRMKYRRRSKPARPSLASRTMTGVPDETPPSSESLENGSSCVETTTTTIFAPASRDWDPMDLGAGAIVTAEMPPVLLPRSMATPSLVAKIAHEKYGMGVPLFRLERLFRHSGFPLDRGTMSRWLEHVGNTLGSTVLQAAREEAMRSGFCIATDATGIAVQPIREDSKAPKKRQACRKGHYFVQVVDRDHVFFEYVPKETSEAVQGLFEGFQGYVLADAKSVYDILFRPAEDTVEGDEGVCTEVGCWAHARRKFYDAAVISNDAIAREGLFRIRRFYALEDQWRDLTPDQRTSMRNRESRPEVEDFFRWVEVQWLEHQHRRGLLRTALGYARRQSEALKRFLDDGRLALDNNVSERELRNVAVGRKAWLFVGSDDHAQAAASFFGLISSCRLHGLEPETYLRDLFRVLPSWPRERYLELAPKYWARTRALLCPKELDLEIGWLTIPPPHEPPSG